MAFFQEQVPRQPFLRAPAVVIWLIALLIGVHAALTSLLASRIAGIAVDFGFVPARYLPAFLAQKGINPGTIFDRALPFVTHMFLHGSWTHVLINSVWLLAFGPVVARRYGTLLFLCFFVVCGIAGALAHLGYESVRLLMHLASDGELLTPVVGASGAISGLMAGGFRMLPLERSAERRPLAPLLSGRILVWTAIWTLVNVIVGVTGLGTGSEVQPVAWMAHLGGYAAGLLLAGPFDALTRAGAEPLP